MTERRNFIQAVNGFELSAADIGRSQRNVIVVTAPSNGRATQDAIIHLPKAVEADGELSIVVDFGAFAFRLLPADGETISGRSDYRSASGCRLVPLIGSDGASLGWGLV